MKDNKDKNKLILSIVAVVLVIVLIAGGTFAWWTWTSSNNTAVSFTVSGGSMTIDGGGNITAQKMVPTASCNGSYAIVKTVKVNAVNSTNTSMTAKVNLNLTGLPAALKTANMKYFISESSSAACTTPTGTFASSGNSMQIATFNVAAATTVAETKVTKTYYLYIWLDSAETSTATQGQSFTITYTGTLEQNAS